MITQGNLNFRQGSTFDEKEKGYEQMKSGCKMLFNYVKEEQNQTLKQNAKEHLVKIIAQLEEMNEYLEQYRKSMNPQKVNNLNLPQSDYEKWSKIVGIEQTKASLAESILLPLQFPDLFTGLRKPWRGILLFGPSGSGKESLAKSCVTKCGATFFYLTNDISPGTIYNCFQVASQQKKSLIYIKQLDQLEQQFEKAKLELIIAMDQYANQGHVQILGGSTQPWTIDTEILKRFEKKIYIQLPNFERRRQLIMSQLTKLKQRLSDEDLEQINKLLEGFTIVEINNITKEACLYPKQVFSTNDTPTPDMQLVTLNHFLQVLSNNKWQKTNTIDYEEWNSRFGT